MAEKRLTELLQRWQNGESQLEETIMEIIYPELRTLAQHYISAQPFGITLQATELVNEAYLKIARFEKLQLNDRRHFYAIAAKVIRSIVIDRMRRRSAGKRGGGLPLIPIQEASEADIAVAQFDDRVDWLAVDQALKELNEIDPQTTQIVELKFFAGLSNDAICEALDLSRATVVRRWRFAKAWLMDKFGVTDE